LGGHETSHVLIAVWNALVRMAFFGLSVEAVARLRASLERERQLARTDALTGLLNGRVFRELVAVERERAIRYAHGLALAYVDVDNFKWVNDRLGHQGGDRVLSTLGELLRTRLRKTDTSARLGGDEFAVLMPETNAANAEIAMGKLRDELAQLAAREGWPISLSVGIVEFTKPPADVDAMLRVVDGLMYEAKRGGKDAIRAMSHRDGEPLTDPARNPPAKAAPAPATSRKS
jgi:diguanylate cyclase (GGDEF)-like protein